MPLSSTKSSSKEFTVHPALIYSLITKQASGVPKALLELVMNSVDAGSTKIDITISETGYSIADNGKGFADKEQIVAFFGTFGTPHESGDAYYGRFRLGRAQSFGYSSTKWYSKDFCMSVDLNVELETNDKEAPLGYKVSTNHPYYDGCKIIGDFYSKQNVGAVSDFYNLSASEKPENLPVIPALIKMIRYLPVDVFINGEKVNKHLDSTIPLVKTKNALFFIEEIGNLKFQSVVNVYNKGVYAYQINSNYHVGDVVAFEALDLNIARNEAKFNCPIAKEISNKIKYLDRKIDLELDGHDDKDKDGNQKSIKKSQELFIEEIWEMVLGLKPLNVDSLRSDFKKKSIYLANDSKVSIFQIFKELKQKFHMIQSKELSLYYYDVDNVPLGLNKDFMGVGNGLIPKSLFPSKNLISKLNFKIISHRSSFEPKELGEENFNDKFTVVFQSSDSDGLKLGKLLNCLMNSVYVIMDYLSEDCSYRKTWSYRDWDICPIKDCSLVDIQDISKDDSEAFGRVVQSMEKAVKLTEFQKNVLDSIRIASTSIGLCNRIVDVKNINRKNVLAFTDGAKYIVFTEEYFSKCLERGDFETLLDTYIHEVSHSVNSAHTHQHGANFYQKYRENFAKSYYALCKNFYEHIGQRLEKRINNKGVSVLEYMQVPEKALTRIIAKRLGGKVQAFG